MVAKLWTSATNGGPPNPRLQRTRSASPPSPLSRQPLGRASFVVAIVAVLSFAFGCATYSRGDPKAVLSYQGDDGLWHEDVAGVIAPTLLRPVEPLVPEPRNLAKSGTVVMKALIGRSGKVEDVVVLESVSSAVDREAVRAVRQWGYRAAQVEGRSVPVWLRITVTYRLPNG